MRSNHFIYILFIFDTNKQFECKFLVKLIVDVKEPVHDGGSFYLLACFHESKGFLKEKRKYVLFGFKPRKSLFLQHDLNNLSDQSSAQAIQNIRYLTN